LRFLELEDFGVFELEMVRFLAVESLVELDRSSELEPLFELDPLEFEELGDGDDELGELDAT
jgi:hypothetical protein